MMEGRESSLLAVFVFSDAEFLRFQTPTLLWVVEQLIQSKAI
jgi:hypothetical protein